MGSEIEMKVVAAGMLAVAAPSPLRASPIADLVIGLCCIAGGAVFAFDPGNVSGALLRNSSGFTPWGRKRAQWRGPNPFTLLGWISWSLV